MLPVAMYIVILFLLRQCCEATVTTLAQARQPLSNKCIPKSYQPNTNDRREMNRKHYFCDSCLFASSALLHCQCESATFPDVVLRYTMCSRKGVYASSNLTERFKIRTLQSLLKNKVQMAAWRSTFHSSILVLVSPSRKAMRQRSASSDADIDDHVHRKRTLNKKNYACGFIFSYQ